MTVAIPTLPEAPEVNSFAQRCFDRLPEAYRGFDATSGYPLRLYLDAITQLPGDIQVVIDRITGQRPVGPALPEPWSLHPDSLESYRANRVLRRSELGDPVTADAAWLPWLVQMVGGELDPSASVAEQRDTIRYATSGWLAGTRASIEYAARTALTGSQYAKCVPHVLADGSPGGPWDVVIITRGSETPDPAAVLGAVLRKGVKPAGVVLRHRTVEASWNILEASRPPWALWEVDSLGVVTWNRLAETGLSYASVPGNLVPNASYEADTTLWTAGANTTKAWLAGGVDGVGQCRLTATASGQVSVASNTFAVTAGHDYRTACSVKPTVTRVGRLIITYSSGPPTTGPTVGLTAGVWTRLPQLVGTAPVGATTASVSLQVDALAAAETVLVDAWDAREYHG
jgi:hypothetical protein